LLGAAGGLGGCTTMVAHDAIEPYIKDKQKRNALESLAEDYCRQKRAPAGGGTARLPDYIYTTDGCSRWPDGSWKACCVVHDIAYWCGGGAADREQADDWLRQCANDKAQGMGGILYLGTRVGGVPWLPTPWRWGYGWDDWPRGYEAAEPPAAPPVKALLDMLKARSIVEEHLRHAPKDPAP
jgi:hypothetical protein